jgi:hypothetical protein
MTGVAGTVACGLALLCHLAAGGGVDLAALARGDRFVQTPLSIFCMEIASISNGIHEAKSE